MDRELEGRISIHALLAESDHIYTHPIGVLITISIHALLAESDAVQIIVVIMYALFLSTLSLRRATVIDGQSAVVNDISIHALLAESDFGRAFWPGLSF